MKIETLKCKLENQGLNVSNISLKFGDTIRAGLCVNHDYFGPYPTAETFQAHQTACKIAQKYGYTAQARGHYVATYIYQGG